MKKNIALISALMASTLLAGCAQQDDMTTPTQSQAASDPTDSQDQKDQAGKDTNTASPDASSNQPISSIELTQKDNRLLAKITTDWNGAPEDSLRLQWQAPKDSYCVSTSFPIKQYQQQNDVSWAYRTINHMTGETKITCDGTWKAQVIDTQDDDQPIASATINVSED